MSPFFFDFTFNKDTPYEIKEELLEAPISASSFNYQNPCPYVIPTVNEIIKDIEKSAYSVDKSKLLSDIFECGAIAISNQVDKVNYDEREEQYLKIINGYTKEYQQHIVKIFSKIFALLSSVVYDDGVFNDYLGEIFMRSNAGNKHAGQFFTPYHISRFMAQATLLEDLVKEKTEDDRILTLNDCCSGGGGMMIAALDVLKKYGVNYARNCFIDCGDIDIRCVHMTYLQLALAGVPAIVRHQDALTREQWSTWLTPAAIFQYTRFFKYL